MALGFLTTTSSSWLSCSGMLSGLVGIYWSVFAPSAFAAASAPTRTVWKKGLVWFLVKTAMVSRSAGAPAANPPDSTSTAPISFWYCFMFPSLFWFVEFCRTSWRMTACFHIDPDRQDDNDTGDERLPARIDRQ